MARATQARLLALTDAVKDRTPQPAGAPTIGDLPNAVEIAGYFGIILELEGSTDPDDQQRVRVAALRAGALMPRPGHPDHPDAGLLGAVVWEEETGAAPDPRFWQAVGGRPECNWAHAGASRDSPPDLVHFP